MTEKDNNNNTNRVFVLGVLGMNITRMFTKPQEVKNQRNDTIISAAANNSTNGITIEAAGSGNGFSMILDS